MDQEVLSEEVKENLVLHLIPILLLHGEEEEIGTKVFLNRVEDIVMTTERGITDIEAVVETNMKDLIATVGVRGIIGGEAQVAVLVAAEVAAGDELLIRNADVLKAK